MTQRTVPQRRPASRNVPNRGRKRKKSIVDQRRTPWGLVLAVVAVVAFAAVVVVMVTASGGKKSSSAKGEVMPAAVTGAVTTERTPQRVTDSSGISGVVAWNTTGWPGDGSTPAGSLEHQHVAGAVRYTETPPVGGPHSATWLNAGIYDQPVPAERAVHDMEHGAVWITYRPGLSAAAVRALRDFVLGQKTLPEATSSGSSSSRYVVMSPWTDDSLPAPVVISAWGHQLAVGSSGDPRLQRFVDAFRSSKRYSPEQGEAVDGVPTDVGGRPLYA